MSALGLIGSAMASAGEAGVKYQAQSSLNEQMAEIMRERDARLAELQRANLEHAENLRRAPGQAAAKDIEAARTGFVDDPSGSARTRTPSEMAQAEQSAYLKHGLVEASMQARQLEQQRERDSQAALDRTADNNRQERALDLSVKTFNVNAQGADLDRQIKQLTLNNAKRVEELRTEFKTANPERKQAITEEVQLLTGKDNDRYLPVPLKDETGAITGYRIFDTKRGDWKEPPAGPAALPPAAAIAALKADPKLASQFDAKYGQGSAARHLQSERPRHPGDRIVPHTPGHQSGAAQPNPDDDVLPHERGRRREAEAVRSVPPLARSVGVGEVRTVLGKQAYNANDRLLLESFKDSDELTPQERSRIAQILKGK